VAREIWRAGGAVYRGVLRMRGAAWEGIDGEDNERSDQGREALGMGWNGPRMADG
jgi:hypothetical protein